MSWHQSAKLCWGFPIEHLTDDDYESYLQTLPKGVTLIPYGDSYQAQFKWIVAAEDSVQEVVDRSNGYCPAIPIPNGPINLKWHALILSLANNKTSPDSQIGWYIAICGG